MISQCLQRECEDYQECVSWHRDSFRAGEELSSFLQSQVRSRLDDQEETESLHHQLRGLDLTKMGKEGLEEVLTAQTTENRLWAAGEALAEAYGTSEKSPPCPTLAFENSCSAREPEVCWSAVPTFSEVPYLEETENMIFPWNMERDKRNPSSSLPGADLIGFVSEGTGYRFALGEVKTSSEQVCPPQIMSGRSGHMGHQIDSLADDMTIIYQLIRWLHSRTKGRQFEQAFKCSSTSYFNSGKKSIVLFGILIRDTYPNKRDVSIRGDALRQKLTQPTRCKLIALYLPWRIKQLVSQIRQPQMGGKL